MKCKTCEEFWGENIFLWLPDDAWEKIGYEPNDFICAHCIIDKLKEFYFAGYMVFNDGKSKINGASSIIEKKKV